MDTARCRNSIALAMTFVAIVAAQDAATQKKNKTVDPTGTWVWEQEFGGNKIGRELRLRLQDNKLSGTYKSIYEDTDNLPPGLADPVDIKNAQLKGDEVSFDIVRKFNENEMTISFSGVIVGDELAGMTTMNFGGEDREFEWMAKRVKRKAAKPENELPPAGKAEQPEPRETPPAEDNALTTPGRIPAPGPESNRPYLPQPILPGGIVIPLYATDSPLLNQDRVREAERYNMSKSTPGRIQSIVNIHNPSIEVHTVDPSTNTGTAIILAAGGGHRTLNVGTEAGDFVPYFYNLGVNTVILRNRLRSDGYSPQDDAVNDALQAIRLVRAHANTWGIAPDRIGIIGFSAGAELSGPTAVLFDEYDKTHHESDDPLAGVSARPDFVGLLYPGPTPFSRDTETAIPRNAPPSFLATAGSGDRMHAIWAVDYFNAMLKAGIPNIELHVYGNGVHAGGLKDRQGIPFGSWQDRYIDWFRDLGFLQKPEVATKATIDSNAFVAEPPPGRRANRPSQ